jgi:hypothetical protein
MADEPETGSGKCTIPYFFYDVISFIIPGATLILGSFWIWLGKDWSAALFCYLRNGGKEEGSIAAISVIVGVLFILFLAVSSVCGFVLSTLSYQLVEKLLWRRLLPRMQERLPKLHTEYSLQALEGFMGGPENAKSLRESYRTKFGRDLTKEADIDHASNICTYFIWSRNTGLGTITARFDAEKIMAQSSVLVGALLLGELLFCCFHQGQIHDPEAHCFVWSATIFAFLIASLIAFDFHRKKRVYGRFQIFLALAFKEHER